MLADEKLYAMEIMIMAIAGHFMRHSFLFFAFLLFLFGFVGSEQGIQFMRWSRVLCLMFSAMLGLITKLAEQKIELDLQYPDQFARHLVFVQFRVRITANLCGISTLTLNRTCLGVLLIRIL